MKSWMDGGVGILELRNDGRVESFETGIWG